MSGEKDGAAWIVTELSLPLAGPPPEGEVHPERTPVGPFTSRADADAWAMGYVQSFGPGCGSWSCAQLRTPPTTQPRTPAGSTEEATS